MPSNGVDCGGLKPVKQQSFARGKSAFSGILIIGRTAEKYSALGLCYPPRHGQQMGLCGSGNQGHPHARYFGA